VHILPHGYDMPLRENWEKLKGLAPGILPSPEGEAFLRLLDALKEDQPNGQQRYLGFYRAPPAIPSRDPSLSAPPRRG
jgi:hypothetical protein